MQQKARFMSRVCHELRSSLQIFGIAADALKESSLDGDAALALSRIERAVASIAHQLHDLQTIDRGEVGKLEIHPGPFEANEMLEDLVQEHRAVAAEKGLELVIAVPKVRTYVVADVFRIRQILNNLLSNAVKYTQTGVVTVALRRFDPKVGRLCFSVSDTGPGIS
ncbi:MAG: HAMP domain-containing sensor histidine kinase [Mycobacterium sp.]|nr:HAMP domain-containing sensor histidine kinase [Mycobacterium sp.]